MTQNSCKGTHSRDSELAHMAGLSKLQVRVRVHSCHRCPNIKHTGTSTSCVRCGPKPGNAEMGPEPGNPRSIQCKGPNVEMRWELSADSEKGGDRS